MKFTKFFLTIASLALIISHTSAQCTTWNDLPNRDHLEGQHSVYRGLIKSENFQEAFDPWKEVYNAAPAADGLRDFHYTDGIEIYKNLFANESDETKKEEYKQIITKMYDDCASCYEMQVVKLSKCGDDQDCYNRHIGYLMGRKGYDMYYTLNMNYEDNMNAFEKAVNLGGNSTEYIVFAPYGAITVYQYKEGLIDKQRARDVHRVCNEIAEYNVANNDEYGAYYQQAIDAMNGYFAEIEAEIFDCQYFIEKYQPDYRDNPDPEVAQDLFNLLKLRGCPNDGSNEFMNELKSAYEKWAAQVNAQRKAEYEANNPGIVANKLYKAGKFNEAIDKYNEALQSETDNLKKAKYHFSKASILFRKLKRYNDARREARTAGQLDPNYGRPWMLIGDMYASTARSCGDSWNQRLAILAAIDKYNHAKKIDPSVVNEASTKTSKYRSSFPSKEDGFMRGIGKGAKQKVGCWIGETVSVRFKD